MSFVPSNEQKAIFNAINNTLESIVVEAVPGSGKSTTMVNFAKKYLSGSDNFMMMAFNVSIREALKGKLPQFTDKILGVNQYFYRLLANELGARQGFNKPVWCNVSANKYVNIAKGFVLATTHEEIQSGKLYKEAKTIANTIDLIRESLTDLDSPESIAKFVSVYGEGSFFHDMIDSYKLIMEIGEIFTRPLAARNMSMRYWGKTYAPNPNDTPEEAGRKRLFFNVGQQMWQHLANDKFAKKSFFGKKPIIDFVEQVYLPYKWGIIPENIIDLLFVDEAQDFSLLKASAAMTIATRAVVFGDKYQSMYMFGGASPTSMEDMAGLMGNVIPLSKVPCPHGTDGEPKHGCPRK